MIYYVKSENYISQRSSKRRGFSSGIRFPPTVNVERVGWDYPLLTRTCASASDRSSGYESKGGYPRPLESLWLDQVTEEIHTEL